MRRTIDAYLRDSRPVYTKLDDGKYSVRVEGEVVGVVFKCSNPLRETYQWCFDAEISGVQLGSYDQKRNVRTRADAVRIGTVFRLHKLDELAEEFGEENIPMFLTFRNDGMSHGEAASAVEALS